MARNETTFTDGHEGKGGRPKGSPNKATLEVRELARGLIEDPEYQTSLRQRLIAGKAPHMESLLWTHLYGKPVERHEVTASARAAGPEDSERAGSDVAYEHHLKKGEIRLLGGVITQAGAERLRRLGEILMQETKTPEARERMRRRLAPHFEAIDKERAKAKAAGESPSGTTPPTEAA
jgi:hypothetical protein